MKNEVVIQLLDAAKAMTGSDYKTAKLIHAPRMTVSNWRSGRATMPAADVVLVAKLGGLDPVDWGCRAICAKYEGTQKGEDLREALKKVWEVIGEDAVTYSEEGKRVSHFIRCINSQVTRLRTRGKVIDRRATIRGRGRPPIPPEFRVNAIRYPESLNTLLGKRGGL